MAIPRDDFPQHTKNAVALRAGHVCSFDGCGQSTAGPSEEAPEAVTMIGVAAHICAAAPGGPRYDRTMTPEERSHIDNGIWLCQTHSVVIDRDEVTYTSDVLRQMKRRHEESRSFAPASLRAAAADDVIAIGDGIIGVGEFLGVDASGWRARLKHFIIGDPLELVSYASNFSSLTPSNQYVLMNAIGDGRVLREAPAITRKGNEYDITFAIQTSYPRVRAQDIGSTFAISPETGDMFVKDGNIARVSGLDALPQNLQTSLGLAMGESPFHRRAGSRISLFYRDFAKTRWLEQLIKMEIIRLASIPAVDEVTRATYTSLRCVDLVREVEVLADSPTKQRLPVRVALDVHGVGRWQHDISIFILNDEQLKRVAECDHSWMTVAMR